MLGRMTGYPPQRSSAYHPDVRITGDSGVSVELEPLKWQFPADAGEWDDRWLVIRGRIDLGDRNWSFTDPCLLMTDARELARWLHEASESRIGISPRDCDGEPEPDLVFLEPALEFSVAEYQEAGPVVCIHLAAEAAPPWLRATDPHLARFAVELAVRTGQLAAAASDWTEQLNALPARPWADAI
jgi:hypothetical protein